MASHSKLIKLDRIIAILSKRKEETKPRHEYAYPSLFSTLHRMNGLAHFRRSYRMCPESFRTLVGIVRPSYLARFSQKRRAQLRAETKLRHALAASLRLCAGGSYLDVKLIHGFSRGKLFDVFWDCIYAADGALNLEPFFDEKGMEERAEFFGRRTGGIMGGCVGCIDGLFVETIKPSTDNSMHYTSRKGKFGVNVQAICDHKYRFTWMSALATGSTHDSAAWGLTELYDQIGIIVPYYINGDAAYPASEVMLVPFKGISLSMDKDAFNYFQSAVRIRIENSFGILRNRWLILKKPIQLNPLRVPMFVRVLMKLHNFIIDMEDPEPPLEAMSFRSSHVHMRPAERPHRRQKSSIREKITRDLAEAGLLRPGRS